jgi:hypothetical protein
MQTANLYLRTCYENLEIKLCKAYHPSISLHARHFLLPHYLKNTIVPEEKVVFELNSFNAFNANLTALLPGPNLCADNSHP